MRFLTLLALAGCAYSDAKDEAQGLAEPPAIKLKDVRFVSSRGDEVFVEGHAASLTYLRESGDGTAVDVHLKFPRTGDPSGAFDVTAPRAHGNPFDEQVTGEGKVTFANGRGERGETAIVRYDGKRGGAEGDKPLKLWGPGFVVDAPGFHWRESDDALDLGPSTLVTQQ